MPDISAQIPDCGVRRFTEITVGMMNIPQRSQLVARIIIHKRTEPSCIRVNACCFYQQCNFFVCGIRKYFIQEGANLWFVVIQCADGNIRNVHGACNLKKHPDCIRVRIFAADILRRIKTGDFQP